MAPPKRKSSFNSDFEKIYGIKRSKKGDGFFFCNYCLDDYNLESMGKTAITVHQEKAKHKAAVCRKQQNQTIQQFVQNKTAPTSIDLKVAAAEGTWAFHIIKHHHSFASADCVSSDNLFKQMFGDSEIAKKFSSAQKKQQQS